MGNHRVVKQKKDKPVNFNMRVCVSRKVNDTDIVVVKNTNRDIIRTPHFVTK